MKEIVAPSEEKADPTKPSLFVSGGITGAPLWQPEYIEMLKETDLVVFNPRRPEFDVRDPNNTIAQIKWEADRLAAADAISFWFPAEPLCPITLYELGRWTPTVVVEEDPFSRRPILRKKTLFIGVHPEYRRRDDVELQTKLARPELEIVYSLKDLAHQVDVWWHTTNV